MKISDKTVEALFWFVSGFLFTNALFTIASTKPTIAGVAAGLAMTTAIAMAWKKTRPTERRILEPAFVAAALSVLFWLTAMVYTGVSTVDTRPPWQTALAVIGAVYLATRLLWAFARPTNA